ncbi:hypothetical protein F4781DRAFT_388683 [Annulohypoxylon bovei var. microspora]|nr:hypothetical protein F4781DRAFT_388683 [Annulohypoxylon bovei var. microspora]
MERDPSPPHIPAPPHPKIVVQEPTPPSSERVTGRQQTSKHEQRQPKVLYEGQHQRQAQYHQATADASHAEGTDKDNDKEKTKTQESTTDEKGRKHLRYRVTHQHHYHIHHHHYHTNYLPGSDAPQHHQGKVKHQWYAPPPASRDLHGYVQMPGHQGVHVESKDPDADNLKPHRSSSTHRHRHQQTAQPISTSPNKPQERPRRVARSAPEEQQHSGPKPDKRHRRHAAKPHHAVPQVAQDFSAVSGLAARRKHKEFGGAGKRRAKHKYKHGDKTESESEWEGEMKSKLKSKLRS